MTGRSILELQAQIEELKYERDREKKARADMAIGLLPYSQATERINLLTAQIKRTKHLLNPQIEVWRIVTLDGKPASRERLSWIMRGYPQLHSVDFQTAEVSTVMDAHYNSFSSWLQDWSDCNPDISPDSPVISEYIEGTAIHLVCRSQPTKKK